MVQPFLIEWLWRRELWLAMTAGIRISNAKNIFLLRFYYVDLIKAEIGSIVPLGRGYFPHDSRHFVPGYYRAVPPGQKPFALR